MGPISHYTRNSGVLQKTFGTSMKDVGGKMMQPLKGQPYGVSYRRDPNFYGRSKTVKKVW